MAAIASEKDISVIEAPVTGSIPLADAGEITVLVGAEPDVLARHQHLLQIVGDPVIHLGPVGVETVELYLHIS